MKTKPYFFSSLLVKRQISFVGGPMYKYRLVLLFVLSFMLLSCATSSTLHITSDPPGTLIYSASTKITLIDEKCCYAGTTPFTLTTMGQWIDWYYQAKKTGYEDSEIIFKKATSQGEDRFVHFILKEKIKEKMKEIEPVIAETVSITGSAGALKRLTAGGPGEYALELSPNKRWLLLEVWDEKRIASTKTHGIQKLDIESDVKVVLTPLDNNSEGGIWAPDMKSIIYSSDKLGSYTIVESLGITGEVGVRFITLPAMGSARNPSISPNGDDITFSINAAHLGIIRRDGSNLRLYGEGTNPTWSPDGKTLLFTRKVGKYDRILKMDADSGRNLIELSSIAANDYLAKFSPDGKRIAFISDRVGGYRHLFIMDIDGKAITQLTEGNFNVLGLTWGRDGYIYFTANAGGNWDVWRLEPSLEHSKK